VAAAARRRAPRDHTHPPKPAPATRACHPLCTHSAPTLHPLCTHSAPTLRPLCAHSAPTLRPLCAHSAPTLRPLCTWARACHPLCLSSACLRPPR
jgi:hypothetical protein